MTTSPRLLVHTAAASRSLLTSLLAAGLLAAGCGQAPEETASPSELPPPAPTPASHDWSWSRSHATITPEGHLEWAPEPFAFRTGPSVRYIDFEAGDDANDGLSTASPWQRHPWDPEATGEAAATRGVHTYVFKRGSTYRGTLVARDSGTPEEPIRLTSDPNWGEGEAVIAGSLHVTGWRRGADHPDIPDPENVWYADLDFSPRNVFVVSDGEATRLALARIPNWEVSHPDDPLNEWWTWDQPEWWRDHWKITTDGGPRHLGIDAANFTREADYYVGAVLRTEYGNVMGTPYPTRVEAFVPVEDYVDLDRFEHGWARNQAQGQRGVVFQGMWFGDSTNIRQNHRFYLEDKPHYLDAPGQFWFDRRSGESGRLYLRLPGDRDPNTVQVEAARHIHLLQDIASHRTPARLDILNPQQTAALNIEGVSHLEVSGLSFRFTNTHWDLTLQAWGHERVANGAIQLRGTGENIRITHNAFEHVAMAVRVALLNDRATMDRLHVADNRIQFLDHGALALPDGRTGGSAGEVRILRNRLHDIGMRPYRNSHGHAITALFPRTMEIAGNILTRAWGAGILIHGGKGGSSEADVPFARYLIHHNSVIDSLLAADDWGGIATWQGGPFYVYNNISGNPGGLKYTGSSRDGYAYYQDGGFKNYVFNNVAWGRPIQPGDEPIEARGSFYQAVPNILNHYVNNTAHRFDIGTGWSPAGGRQLYLGNVWKDIHREVFDHGRQKEDAAAEYRDYLHETIGYSRNVFRNTPRIGTLEGTGYGSRDSVEGFANVAREAGLWADDVGLATEATLFRDSSAQDFRPRPGSPVIDQGVRFFVPWALSGVVGEWTFRRNRSDPTVIIDEHWYMTPYYINRFEYRNKPTHHLTGVNITAGDYRSGSLEDWTEAALAFNGRDQYARLSHEDMTRPYHYRVGNERRSVAGADRVTPDIHYGNLLIEAVLRTEPGHTGGVLVAKTDGRTGYSLAINAAGSIGLAIAADGSAHSLDCGVPVNDGQWHHVIAELDRSAGLAHIYIDGLLTAEGAIALPADTSLSNPGDLTVARGPDGDHFAGELDFLRIARGTLADAETTIEELYAWQFNGPFLRDFAGRPAHGQRRDAGAFEFTGD
ncbi:MAG: hypothetical protein EA425_11270 [Puniceicoccaceae bacterium]|nr:MAG: hypothetical protein EA425_11270 [Puniceicoccaceae bacterium]